MNFQFQDSILSKYVELKKMKTREMKFSNKNQPQLYLH